MTADGGHTAQALRAQPAEQLPDAYGPLSVQLVAPGNAAPPTYPVLGAPGMCRTRQQALADGAPEGKPLVTYRDSDGKAIRSSGTLGPRR